MKKIFNRRKGESTEHYNKRAHEEHLKDWSYEKHRKGEWLSKSDYEKKTGKEGKRSCFD